MMLPKMTSRAQHWSFFHAGTTFLVFISLSHILASGEHKIPKHRLGLVYKSTEETCNPPVTLTFYIDTTCIDSKTAFPTILTVADYFGPEKVKLVTHLFSLPYHRNSHVIAKGAHVIDTYSNGKTTYQWLKTIFDNLNYLTTSATRHLNDKQVLKFLALLAQRVSGISQDQFSRGVLNGSADLSARLDWKYGCTRGVYETPSFMVNDVIVPADKTWTVDQWIALIQPLLYSCT